MILQSLGTMFVFMMVRSFTLGPGNILALNTMIRYGWREGKKLILGIICGYFTVQYICTLAVLGLNRYAHFVLSILKYFGAAYLVWYADYRYQNIFLYHDTINSIQYADIFGNLASDYNRAIRSWYW